MQLQQQQQQQQSGAAATTTNGGPRVSFNRDVHVKRIGKHPSEYETSPGPSYHQLPPDIDPADIRKEAALVIAQAGRHHSKAENGDRDNISNFRSKQKRQSDAQRFHSLPTRKKKGKPVARSASDASTKKPASKRPSIFGLFSRKSDSNVSQLERDPRFEDVGARRLVRSKSDVGGRSATADSRVTKRLEAASATATVTGTGTGSASKQQLSPIIEQAQREDFFEKDYFRERERRKSDAVTLREKDESGLSELLNRSRSQVEPDASPAEKEPPPATVPIGGTTSSASISAGIRDRIDTLKAKSNENMHSSQQPAERLPLTKGRTVDGLVKRLSMERFSPQPYISQPGFSYIRPNEGITYAQLDHSPLEETRQRSPLGRDMRSPQREFAPARPPRANDRAQHSPGQGSYSPTSNGGGAPLHPRVSHSHSHSHSPSPWQQLSPRNLSDEDEGLGYEPRKVYYEDEYPPRRPEPPIVPVIRSVSPAPYLDELGYRRAQLETRILTRRFGEGATTLERHREHNNSNNRVEPQPERERERDRARVYLSPEREEERFQRQAVRPTELSNEYQQQERSQVDGTLPKMEKTSRYRHTKYYDDGHGGVKETYVRETQKDGQIRESRHRERIGERERDYNSADRLEHEPKSLDSQLTGTDLYRSSPELRPNQQQLQQSASTHQQQDYWQSSLKRDKLQQRSFDKGDSGIENDFRKESFNGDLTTRWRKRTAQDDMRACESFLRKERRDSAQQRQLQRQAIIPARLRRENSYVYRERSIDDGSHFDPHLDKYPVATSTLRRREQHSQSQSQSQSQSREDSSTLKRNKKLGGFEKVKQLFTGAASGSNGGSGRSSGSNVSSGKKELLSNGNSNSSTLSRRDKEKQREREKERERYMVREEEMRSRYREHQALAEENSREPKTIDISMRRRLSTPKASPLLLKRSPADKPPKKLPPKAKEATPVKVEKTSWFKSLDRRAKSSPKELNVSVNGHSENTSSLKRSKRNATAAPAKNLRFFGDTDLDSNPPTISKASSMPRSRPSLGQSKHSQSAYNLDRSPPPPSRDYRHTLSGQSQGSQSAVGSRQRASSMQHLDNGSDEVDFRKRRHYSRSRELHDISESGSEPEPAERHKRSSMQRAMSLERSAADGQRGQRFEDRPLMGPPKPARSAERRELLSSLGQENVGYGRDRFPAESSGTEGESSLHSQRSVVYLHATTVGDIPQPYNLRRRSVSREDLRKAGTGAGAAKQQPPPLQPMTRTVSRSVSMLAPWKPKHISEGYEINYSQEQNKRMSTLPRKPPPHTGATSASTLSRLGRKHETSTPSRRYHMDSLDRPPPPRSVLSASNLRSAKTK